MPTIKRAPRTWVVYADRGDLDAALSDIKASGGGPVRWFVSEPTERDEAAARRAGLSPERDLLRLERSLPVDAGIAPIRLRAFVPAQDERDWVDVNNRSFAAHPEQGGWTVADLTDRESEPWFDPEGFLLHHDESTGALAGFVWTKVHADASPPVGEIYVIGVDPRFQGRGLGRTLTLAGLDWMHRVRGITEAMLYVDGANAPALAMYDRLGFRVANIDRAFAGVV